MILTELAELVVRAETALESARRLTAEQIMAVSSLLCEQLRMAEACLDLAMLGKPAQVSDQFLVRAERLSDAVAERMAKTVSLSTPGLQEQLLSLRQRARQWQGGVAPSA